MGAEEASIDLAPAVRFGIPRITVERTVADKTRRCQTFRHIGFIDSLKHLGWLNPSTWVDRSEALYTARLRYAK